MKATLAEIAALVDGKVIGDEKTRNQEQQQLTNLGSKQDGETWKKLHK